jgi:hypothetical protein
VVIFFDAFDENSPILELLISFYNSIHNIRTILELPEAAAEAERRGIGEGGRNCRREDKCEGDTGHDSMRLYSSESVGFCVRLHRRKNGWTMKKMSVRYDYQRYVFVQRVISFPLSIK